MATATAIAGAAGGAVKFFEGRKMQKKAEQLIDNFEWQKLQNPYADLQVSTLGSDLRREEAARTTSTNVDALRSGGTRALVGGLGRVQQQNNTLNREIGADLDQQQKQIDYATANQTVANQQVMEQRQANELAGYGQMMNVGMGMKFQGIDNGINAVGMFGQTGLGQKLEGQIFGEGGTPPQTNTSGASIIGGTPVMTQGNAAAYYGNYNIS